MVASSVRLGVAWVVHVVGLANKPLFCDPPALLLPMPSLLRKSRHGRHVIERHLGATAFAGGLVTLLKPPNSSQPPKIALFRFQRRLELRLVRLCFPQILVELCKLVLRRLFEDRKVVCSVRLRVASVADLGLGFVKKIIVRINDV